ncbi:heavy-metal-associated domain-containing protein [Parabacteroides sp. Marseille-P3160]|jgi:Cu(I)/Ag(I) efflux system membrane fusion protein|uniref:heavy-metal-associated domain-containing protein n=1 Tax=Parabacteroides sp. Marseille-P3160 TaxID=1917887 RepID=UPI0009B9C35E|nr:heavy-metal-associated domain-containing protein [Parabacteroides sp. Marseille-P3160]
MKKLFFMAALGLFFVTSCHSKSSSDNSQEENQNMEMMHSSANQKDVHAMLGVQGSCEMCKERIEKAAKTVKGVSFANWDVNEKILHLNFDPKQTSVEAISKVIAKTGHDTDKDKATQAAYDALPDCCKYRK